MIAADHAQGTAAGAAGGSGATGSSAPHPEPLEKKASICHTWSEPKSATICSIHLSATAVYSGSRPSIHAVSAAAFTPRAVRSDAFCATACEDASFRSDSRPLSSPPWASRLLLSALTGAIG